MKISIAKTTAFIAIAAMITITSCKKAPYPGYELAESGYYFKFYNHDEKGVSPKQGDAVKVIMSYKNSKDSVLFDSKKMNQNGLEFVEIPLNKPSFKGSFEDALASMAVGDSASFMISADSVYLKTFQVKQLPKYVVAGSMLQFEVKLLKVTTKEDLDKEHNKKMEEQKTAQEARKNQEPMELAKYLEDNKVKTKANPSGLYYIETAKGKGAKPAKGDLVKVNYTGKLLDGTVFDTSDEAVAKQSGSYNAQRKYEPIEFPVGQGQVIPGWDEAIMMMNTGAKAQLILPSSIAYGANGAGPIPPYSTLVFDVELVSFKAAGK